VAERGVSRHGAYRSEEAHGAVEVLVGLLTAGVKTAAEIVARHHERKPRQASLSALLERLPMWVQLADVVGVVLRLEQVNEKRLHRVNPNWLREKLSRPFDCGVLRFRVSLTRRMVACAGDIERGPTTEQKHDLTILIWGRLNLLEDGLILLVFV